MATEALVTTVSTSPQTLHGRSGYAHGAEAERTRVGLGCISVDNVDLAAATERMAAFMDSGRPHQVVTVNLDFISIASRDDTFRATINDADLAVADGMPLVWLSRLQGQSLAERVAGVELVIETCRLAAEQGASVFLLGAAEGVAEAAAQRLTKMLPGLRIAGCYSPPIGQLSPEEDDRIVRMIRDAAPDLLFVALGAPRQDLWIRQHQPELRVPVAMGVGCVFDVLAGAVRRAPPWMQRMGLEWAFRLGQEPHRLWRRYLLNDLPTLARLAWGSRDGRSSEGLVVP
jgi:N-acetylglucosaminyldiphosphoundecaprenol N-acetyl-beta-D-mannosaminyltransferase